MKDDSPTITSAMRSTERFSDIVEKYIKFRPGYPAELMYFLKNEIGLNGNETIADIGSGTGKLSESLLKAGFKVIGIEPNDAMRTACEELMGENSNFISVDGSAENTTLNENSVDVIMAAQAFHWFDVTQCLLEFKRILKDSTYPVFLIWNEREFKHDGIMKEYNRLITDYSIDYRAVNHHTLSENTFNAFFKYSYQVTSFEYSQPLNLDGLRGRYLSCSYALPEEDSSYTLAMEEINRIYDKYEKNGEIVLVYNTTVYYGRI